MLDNDQPIRWREAYGLHIGIENPRGSTRSGVSPDGKQWSNTMGADYGFFANCPNSDGDGTDCFLGESAEEFCPQAFVINQVDPNTKEHDEHKVCLLFASAEAAEQAYLASYDAGWAGLGSMVPVSIDGLKDWLLNGDKSIPMSQGANNMSDQEVKHGEGQSDSAEVGEGTAQVTGAGTEDAQDTHEVTDAVADVPCATCGNPIEFWKKYCTECRGNFTKSELDEKGICPDCGCEYGGDCTSCERCGYSPGTTDSAPMLDAVLISSAQYYVVGEDGAAIADAKNIPPKENGPLKVSLLASLANKRNANGRYFTPGFMRKVAKTATAFSKSSPQYGESPHPAFNEETGQYDTDPRKECWQCLSYHADATGNLWCTVLVDETTSMGARVGTKIRRGEKLGVSVRWTPYANLIKHGRLADGQEVQYFDDDVADAGFSALALDYVPNPAVPEAGHAMFDCEGSCQLPMTDAASLLASPLVNLSTIDNEDVIPDAVVDAAECGCKHAQDSDLPTPLDAAPPAEPPLDLEAQAPSAAVADNAAQEADPQPTHAPSRGSQTASPRGPEKKTQMAKPLTDADIKKMSKRDRKANLRSMLDALKGTEDADEKATLAANADALADAIDDDDEMDDAAKAQATADAKTAKEAMDAQAKAVADALEQMKKVQAVIDADNARKETEAKAQEVGAFVDAVKAGTADELDLSRFDDEDRALLATAANGKSSVADAKTAIEGQIAILDMVNAKHKRAAMGMADNGAKGETVADDKRTETKVEVTLDAGDKAVAELFKGLGDSMDRMRRDQGLPVDPVVREYNQKHFLKEIRERAKLNTPAVQKAVADSAQWLLGSKEARKSIDLQSSQRVMTDAGLIRPVTDAAATNTTTLANQASIASFMLGRVYQDPRGLRYVSGVGSGEFVQVAGAQGNIGTALRIPTRYRNAAPHDYFMDFNSLVVGESQGIPKMSTSTSYQDFPLTKRRLGLSLSKDVEMAILHGPLTNFDPLAFNMSELANEFIISTDNYIYLTMSRASDEINAKVVTGETVAVANITYNAGGSVVQDGITYGTNVTAAVQILPGVTPGTVRDSSLANPTTSTDYKVPVCIPRNSTVLNADGSTTATVINPISAAIGGTPVVFGYLDANKNIQSYVNQSPVATAAWDFANGKLLFKSGVNASTANLVIGYSAVTNVSAYLRLNFASGGYPNSLTASEYFNEILRTNDIAAGKLASAPNFMVPDTLLTSINGSVNTRNASIFYKFLSPDGTSLESSEPIPGVVATRGGLDYCAENAPMPWGDDTALIFKRGTVRYGVDTPGSLEGPYPYFDTNSASATYGEVTDDVQYKFSEFSCFCSPLAKDNTGKIFQFPYTKVRYY